MKQTQIESVGKVFLVVRGMRRCLICDSLFTRRGAAEHAGTLCGLSGRDSWMIGGSEYGNR